ncbi:hypothetical protein CIPAW_07G109900 [Carya illinoinensis]|uniref:Uncharacterized protein n=1 Tax=Carya illinoinensis TaxID=32201 RepID=A0A8T1Q0A6_CARIL|nr:hypothetical protein CIPAW_07G109900 [Carya illinoinensis]
MAETKRKARDEPKHMAKKSKKQQKKHSDSKTPAKKDKKSDARKRTGPRLPNSLRKVLDHLNRNGPSNSEDEEEIESDEGELYAEDLYEYQEGVPQEESKKNRRFDPVENFEYELPQNFKDENVLSDDDDEDDVDEDNGGSKTADANGDEIEEEDGGRHVRMLQGITGMPSEAFERKKKKNNVVISEVYPESEYNPSREILDGDGRISMEDLLGPLQDKPGFGKLRKRMDQMKKSEVERGTAYKLSKTDITKWEPIVKKNREAPTIYFDENTDLGFSTVGAIASEFEPRTEFEKQMASLVYDDNVMEAHRKDGSRLLELNKVSVEDEKERQNRIAKMRSLLFCHEMKAKHIKKIKSKTYHRLLKKNRLKTSAMEIEMDPEAAKEQALKQEFKRAEERMTLKHKNTSKWATRILRRGLQVQDEGTRAAISEQLHQHALLSRKMNSMKDNSSSSGSDDSSDDDDDVHKNPAVSDQGRASKLLEKAKEKTLKILEVEDEVPKSGLLSLPFMERGLKKRKEAADEEAKLALQEYESSLKQMEDSSGAENPKASTSSGRRVFGAAVKTHAPESRNMVKSDTFYANSDSEDDMEAKENTADVGNNKSNDSQKDVHPDSVLPHENTEIVQDSVFKSFDDIVRDPGPKTTYEVAIFASDRWRKMESRDKMDAKSKRSVKSVGTEHNQDSEEPMKEVGDHSDSESEGQMVDGVLALGPKPSYELPSQAELIRQAFAGDDVEEDFENAKQEVLNEENPEPEKPVLLPGWGQWTHVQKKKGLPSWMLKDHENAQRKREEALKKRKDARLKHVIISEKLDVKAQKLLTKTLPYPFTSKEVFEQSIRMPIGPEFNPATTVGALNRPEVVKKPGVIIRPIEFKEVNPHENTEGHKSSGQKQKMKKSKGNGTKMTKKTKMAGGKTMKVK